MNRQHTLAWSRYAAKEETRLDQATLRCVPRCQPPTAEGAKCCPICGRPYKESKEEEEEIVDDTEGTMHRSVSAQIPRKA